MPICSLNCSSPLTPSQTLCDSPFNCHAISPKSWHSHQQMAPPCQAGADASTVHTTSKQWYVPQPCTPVPGCGKYELQQPPASTNVVVRNDNHKFLTWVPGWWCSATAATPHNLPPKARSHNPPTTQSTSSTPQIINQNFNTLQSKASMTVQSYIVQPDIHSPALYERRRTKPNQATNMYVGP